MTRCGFIRATLFGLACGVQGALAGGQFALGLVQIRAAGRGGARSGRRTRGLGGRRGRTRRLDRSQVGSRPATLGLDHHRLGAAMAEALPHSAGGYGSAPAATRLERQRSTAAGRPALTTVITTTPTVLVIAVAHPLALLTSG